MKLSYAILWAGERELLMLLRHLIETGKFHGTEIVILADRGKIVEHSYLHEEAMKLAYEFNFSEGNHACLEFGGDFSRRRNTLVAMCRGEWIFHIDADELPTQGLMEFINNTIVSNIMPGGGSFPDAFAIARENFVAGVTQEYLDEMKWIRDESGRINWPDYQIRLHQKKEHIYWTGKVHETICKVPLLHRIDTTGKFLRHYKTFDQQKAQNSLYKRLAG